ncbi:hypothetical protein GRF29_28g2575515 [Pseudopithomyces chartarum]|uniref:Uncharacterized protein n=1 Tax=Pseudopithomyces chartarum TaxID=1892770 RepID=A0AAN6M1S6_9PLEO|nr:hypothetical protein GRF29_28g2575515 [Pseudopithomyces chartarum]
MKLFTTIAVLAVSLSGFASAKITCGKCAFNGQYCDVAGAYRACWGGGPCGGSTICSSGCHWDPDNPDYGGLAQC